MECTLLLALLLCRVPLPAADDAGGEAARLPSCMLRRPSSDCGSTAAAAAAAVRAMVVAARTEPPGLLVACHLVQMTSTRLWRWRSKGSRARSAGRGRSSTEARRWLAPACFLLPPALLLIQHCHGRRAACLRPLSAQDATRFGSTSSRTLCCPLLAHRLAQQQEEGEHNRAEMQRRRRRSCRSRRAEEAGAAKEGKASSAAPLAVLLRLRSMNNICPLLPAPSAPSAAAPARVPRRAETTEARR